MGNELGYIYTVEYCSAIERNELLIHATTLMNLKGMLNVLELLMIATFYKYTKIYQKPTYCIL